VRIHKLGEGIPALTPFNMWAQARRSVRSDVRDRSDYIEDVKRGVVTGLLPAINLGAAQTLEDWIERGPR
jgi:hypothetical protein